MFLKYPRICMKLSVDRQRLCHAPSSVSCYVCAGRHGEMRNQHQYLHWSFPFCSNLGCGAVYCTFPSVSCRQYCCNRSIFISENSGFDNKNDEIALVLRHLPGIAPTKETWSAAKDSFVRIKFSGSAGMASVQWSWFFLLLLLSLSLLVVHACTHWLSILISAS